jgi:mannose-6-phosphate isomerase-like protein (cupin superfamily)
MTKQYRYTANRAQKFNKYGVDLTVYGENEPSANVCHVSVKKGHFEEFYNKKSTFTYYIIEGKGTFMLDSKPVEAEATDLIVIPPNTRIHYFGTLDMVLTVSPAFNEEDEVHVRFVEESESPYK